MMKWRKEPPTVEEVRQCRYWWFRDAQDKRSQVFCLGLFKGGQIHVQKHYGWEKIVLTEWDGEWCPIPEPEEP